MSNGEFRKMEEELREFCGGNPIVIPGDENKYLRRGRTRLLRIKKKQEPGTRKTMGGISRLRRVINIILNREEVGGSN